MADSNFVQASFLGGEWSPFAQGRIDLPTYPTAMNVCRNGYPLEEGGWIRRSGSRLGGKTFGGAAGRVISLDFEQTTPYVMELTSGLLRMWGVSTQTSQLNTALPLDFRLVTTNDNVQVLDVSTANPAVVQTLTAHGWTTNDQVQFLFATTVNAAFVPLLRARTFKITVTDTTHFSIADAITGVAINGSTLGWSAPTAGNVVVIRILAIVTPYTGTLWSSVRRIQAERRAILLQSTLMPRTLEVTTDPTASAFATFSLTSASFVDGPYLDPPTDGTIVTPNVVPTQGVLPQSAIWSGVAWNGTVFCTVAQNTAVAATSTDGKTWTARTLPAVEGWTDIAWNGTKFCAIASATDQVATSADGITWVAHTLPSSALWSAITSNGARFVAIAGGPSTTAATSDDNGSTWTARTLPTSTNWFGIAWSGTVFSAIANNSAIAATSADGITWVQRSLPSTQLWQDVAWGGTIFCAIAAGEVAATSPDGITWTQRSLPLLAFWSAIAWNGTIFCVVANGGATIAHDLTSTNGITWTTHNVPNGEPLAAITAGGSTFCAVSAGGSLSVASTTGVFGAVTISVSSLNSINAGLGFLSTDIGRSIRLHSEPDRWFSTTTYSTGNAVSYNGLYYVAIAGSTNKPPDISPSSWLPSSAAATWTWAVIQSITTTSSVLVSIQGPDLLYTVPISNWRLGVYSDTTGYPTCGVYYQGRLWLSGAVPNRVDASRPNLIFDMAPTEPDGSVFDNNALSYTFNSDDVNPIFWMVGQSGGIACGTQAGEWLIVAPTAGPITPTNIHASHDTHYGSANIEPEPTQLTISFVQKFNQCVLEFFPDALSGKYTAPNLSEYAKHLTATGIQEIRFQQELLPIIWARCTDGSLIGATYGRDSLYSSQPAKFIGWHRHDFTNGNTVESIAVGPSENGTLDSLAMVHNDGTYRHVAFMRTIFNINDTIKSGWFVDDGIVPSGGVISGKTLTFYGLWDLNDKTVAVTCGGVDLGDFLVTNGSTVVPIDESPNDLFTSAYLASISSDTAYGEMATYIDGAIRAVVPAVVGFTYTSQGQLLRPDTADRSRSQLGVGLAMKRRIGQFGALLHNTQGISFGTDFNNLHDALFQSSGGTQELTRLQLFSGVYWQTVDDTWGFDSMLCWEISRPYPAAVVSIGGRMNMSDRG